VAHAGTEIPHQPGHLECGVNALAGHIAQQEANAVRIQPHDIVKVSPHPPGGERRSRQHELGEGWERVGKHLALDLAGHFQVVRHPFILSNADQGSPEFRQRTLELRMCRGEFLDQRLLFLPQACLHISPPPSQPTHPICARITG
jgi:hypothetical protein